MDEFDISGYKIIVCFSRSVHTGGVLMYIADCLEYDTVSNKTVGDNWFLAVEVKNANFSGIYGGVYHSPSCSSRDFIEYFEDWLQEIICEEKTNVIGGDFNIRWDEQGYSRELKSVVDATGLKQKVSQYTRVNLRSSSLIDLVFCNIDECEANILEDWKITDHETIGVCFSGSPKVNLPNRCGSYVSWKKYSRQKLQRILQNDTRLVEIAPTVEEQAHALSSALTGAVAQLTDVRSNNSSRSNHWYGSALSSIKFQRDNAYRIAKRTSSPENWQVYNILRNNYVREIRSAKNRSIQQEINECVGDSKRLWKCLKALIKPGGLSKTKVVFGDFNEVSDEDTAEKLNLFFIKSVEDIHAGIPSPVVFPVEVNEDVVDQFSAFHPITMQRLKEIVSTLKNCSGTDNVTKRVLVDAFDIIADRLLVLINDSLMQGVFPEGWKKTVVIPVPKVPNSTRAEDHRPINMLPLYEKVLEIVVKDQLMGFIDHSGILLREQSGFRKKHSCETALNLLLLKWKQAIENGKIILAVFVDLKRAFETIDRRKLLNVLQGYGVGGNVLKWFRSYLENRTQVTKYNSFTSPEETIDLGVPQGSVLGPLLFILYINDMKNILDKAELNLFADDTVLFIIGDSFDECIRLMNVELAKFDEWLKWKKLKLNITKTKCMIVTTRARNANIGEVQIDGEIVERVETIKYLGVTLDEKLKFNEHVNYTIRKAAKKFGILCRISRFLTFDSKMTVYKTIIAPHFDYCASILFLASKQQRKRMQILQNKVMRLILQCDRLTPRCLMLDCLQWMSIQQRIQFNTLVFIFKVIHGMTPQYLFSTIVYGRDVHRYETRRAGDLRLLSAKKACTQNSLFYKGYSLFNSLPESAKQTNNIREFKQACRLFVKELPLDL